MAKRSLKLEKKHLGAMSVDGLLRLRADIEAALISKTTPLRRELAALGETTRLSVRGRWQSPMKGRKVAPKYLNPKNPFETWAGRGAMPRWMAAEIKKGKKRESFAIDRARKAKRRASKTSGRQRKAGKAISRRHSAAAPAFPTVDKAV